MTGQTLPYHEREPYLRPERLFYPSDIPVNHSQLRHLVSSPSPNIVYFASLGTIYRLNTRTRKKTRIATLSFEVRSTASGHGWFCAGGEKDFATIKIPDDEPGSSAEEEVVLDAAEPSDPWLRSIMHGGNGSRARFIAHEESLGSDIVNSISIHRIRMTTSSGQERLEPVALVTQNDHFVRLYHLSESKEIWRSEEFDCPMNHATISPDGRLMIIVGDKDTGYIYERVSFSEQHSPRYQLLRSLQLHKPPNVRLSTYFTTAWSESGRLCATASEHGYLMVFETAKLIDPEADPVMVVVPASRAMQSPGPIRTMCFAPSPWDLLMWTENYGRMCIANLRDGLATRQVIDLDPDDEGVIKCELVDDHASLDDISLESFDRNLEYLRRHRRDLGDDPNTLRIASEFMTASAERRRLQRQAGVPDLGGLAEDEQQIINNIRTTRERELERLQNGSTSPRPGAPRSIVYSETDRPRSHSAVSSSWAAIPRALTQLIDEEQRDGQPSPLRQSTQSIADTSTSQSRQDAWQTIERAMHRTTQISRSTNENDDLNDEDRLLVSSETHTALSAAAARATFPNIRDSLSMLEAERARARAYARQRFDQRFNERLTTRGEAVRAREQRVANSLTSGDQVSRSTSANLAGLQNPVRRMGLPTTSDDINQRQLHGTTHTEIDRSYVLPPTRGWQTLHQRVRAEGVVDISDYHTWGDGTTGVSCSRDGRTVFVGTETGIFELKLDYQCRKFWPAMEMR